MVKVVFRVNNAQVGLLHSAPGDNPELERDEKVCVPSTVWGPVHLERFGLKREAVVHAEMDDRLRVVLALTRAEETEPFWRRDST